MFQFINAFIAIALMAAFFPATLNASRMPLYDGDVFIIIEKNLYPHLDNDNLRRWIEQLENEGWKTKVLTPETDETRTANRLKEYMVERGVYLHPDPLWTRLNGVILIGNFPHTYIDLHTNNHLKSDLWYMDTDSGARLTFNRFVPSSTINVNAGFSFDPLSVWVSRIQYITKAPYQGEKRDIKEEGKHINNYLKKNVACRSNKFIDSDCLSENQFTIKKFWESEALISTSVSNKIAGEVFLDSFAKAQKNWKKWQDYIFSEGWEHCYSYWGDMYDTYDRTIHPICGSSFPGPIPPMDKIILYFVKLPALFIAASLSAVVRWKIPSSRGYVSLIWALALAYSLIPQYNCPDKDYTHKRHYLPILFGDGTLRNF
ncbi:hypothetical protein [Endozoicomonas euniceicola]|uniref:DUF4105 domain-containing protein n=1 Tax=Endozoicomonas euniceicola TaxID=1234143 RepID=A0ABY6H046_9GAMM|nr:hypothetical protein [Endozoicomonas euniceicola]UYM17656.1 hypothetical protein NX720_07040 [Endozoicomonas euniceicola]